MAQKIEDAELKADTLTIIASEVTKAGDIKQALEISQKIEFAIDKADALINIAMSLATEPVPENKKDKPVVRRMKKAFTPKEKQLAKQLVEIVQGN